MNADQEPDIRTDRETSGMNGAQFLVKFLERRIRDDVIFGYPGGAALPIYDALSRSSIRHVLVRHEQGAAFMAQGRARVTGRAALCLASSGPGVTNLITGVADAMADSIPLVVVTAQVSTALIGTDAFQEIDAHGLALPITKACFAVRSTADLLEAVPAAFALAEGGRPGPVWIDLPKDVQTAEIALSQAQRAFAELASVKVSRVQADGTAARLREAAALIATAERPVLYAGGGVIHAGASEALRRLARRNSIPVTTTLMGLGAYPAGDELFLGMPGMHGARSTNMILEECDVLIGVGVRFDDRATGKVAEFCPGAKIIHADIDAAEPGKIKRPDIALVCDAGDFLNMLNREIPADRRPGWRERVRAWKERAALPVPSGTDLRDPARLLGNIAAAVEARAIITTDVGQHQMWAAQYFPFTEPRTWLTSGGLGTMGFGLPAAIGAATARPNRTVVCLSGDGSILMNLQELATLRDLGANVKIVVFDNGGLGLVRQQQELFYAENYYASQWEPGPPDLCTIALGFGIPSLDLQEFDDRAAEVLNDALTNPGPVLIRAPIFADANVYPMVPPGKANREMIEGRSVPVL